MSSRGQDGPIAEATPRDRVLAWGIAWRMLERLGARPEAVAHALEELRVAVDEIADASDIAVYVEAAVRGRGTH